MDLIEEMKSTVTDIHVERLNLATARKDKALKKAPLWEEATGTVDAKKDYIKSKLVDEDLQIATIEANIEHHKEMLEILKLELEYSNE